MLIPFLLILLTAVAGAVWQFRTSGGSPERITRTLLPISAGLVLIVLLTRMAQGTGQDWNEAKLAPVVGMTRGFPLYQDPDHGAMTGWIYGPVGAIILLPTALARDPTTAVMLGIFIAACTYLAPIAWAVCIASRGRAPVLAGVALLAAAWESFDAEALSRCIIIAAPDAPALGLGACACAAIYLKRSPMRLSLSAISAVLCVWTKQNFLPIVPALLLWIAIMDGPRTAGVYLAILAAAGALFSGIFLFTFGASNLWFHTVTLPGSHPYRYPGYGTVTLWLLGMHDLLATSLVPLGLLSLVLFVARLGAAGSGSARQWLLHRPWMIYAVLAIFLIPGSLVGYLKIGGFLNSFAVTDYFLVLAAATGSVEVLAALEPAAPLRRAGGAALLMFGLVLSIRANLGGVNGIVPSWREIVDPYDAPQHQAFVYARAHPGEIYCPWNPLLTLMADGQLYHFEWGIIDQLEAKRSPSPEQYLAHFPRNMDKVVYLRPPPQTKALEVLIDFRRPVRLREIPEAIVYTR